MFTVAVFTVTFALLRGIEAYCGPRRARKAARHERELAAWVSKFSESRMGKQGTAS